jgi:hypothetical protein
MKFRNCFILFFAIVSCTVNKQRLQEDLKRVIECRQNRLDSNIQVNTRIRVILFDEQRFYDVARYPAFIIGITPDNDTIGVVDKTFDGKLSLNQLIEIGPDIWTNLEMESLHPLLSVSKDKARNNLYCSFKVLYRGKIKLE